MLSNFYRSKAPCRLLATRMTSMSANAGPRGYPWIWAFWLGHPVTCLPPLLERRNKNCSDHWWVVYWAPIFFLSSWWPILSKTSDTLVRSSSYAISLPHWQWSQRHTSQWKPSMSQPPRAPSTELGIVNNPHLRSLQSIVRVPQWPPFWGAISKTCDPLHLNGYR